ncbi:LLM class flavin-dependent oxidoreductase [Streptomyces sp. NBC_00280]|uniref:LLM class flavin-dependent oxidoreductase n=1 Tax=Streptomyces sp. NBC_00280 TaxID=2975699 RepID=UPI00324A1E87
MESSLDDAVEAERLGYDGLMLTEHHFDAWTLAPSPMVLLAALAARTSRLRLGQSVSILPFHSPWRLAEEAEIGARTNSRRNTTAHEILLELVELAALRAVRHPIAITCPLDRVADAFAALEQRHTLGEIVLSPYRNQERNGVAGTITHPASYTQGKDSSPHHV